jgi:pimeloyl-ACP methyl ester carboxylesterase
VSTVYLLPGLLCDDFVWRHQKAALSGTGEVRIPEFRRFSSLASMAEHVLEDAPRAFALAGHSMGGRVALEIYRLAPERVERLALLDTAAHPAAPGEEDKRQELVDLAKREGMGALAARWLPPMLHPHHSGLYDELAAMVKRATPESFENQQRALLARPDARPVLLRVDCPALVLCGREDAWSPVRQHEEMTAAIRGARLVVIEECGHMSTVEQPAAVTAALRDWLRS